MKKCEVILWMAVVFVCGFIVFGIGTSFGEKSVMVDDTYYHYLKDILPETEDNYVTITLDEEGYHVLYDIGYEEYKEMMNETIIYWNWGINSQFEGVTIWHEPGGMLMPISENKEVTEAIWGNASNSSFVNYVLINGTYTKVEYPNIEVISCTITSYYPVDDGTTDEWYVVNTDYGFDVTDGEYIYCTHSDHYSASVIADKLNSGEIH